MVKEIEKHKTCRLIELEDGRKALECRCGTTLLTDEYILEAMRVNFLALGLRVMMLNYMPDSMNSNVSGRCPNGKCRTYHTRIRIPFPIERDADEIESQTISERGLDFSAEPPSNKLRKVISMGKRQKIVPEEILKKYCR